MIVSEVAQADLPEIQIDATDIKRMADEGVAVLARDGAIFQRAGLLVHVVSGEKQKKTSKIKRAPNAPIIRNVHTATLREHLASGARWLRYDGRSKEYKKTLPPENAVQAIAARGQWGGVRPLASVITAPTLRPDGTLLQKPGYDQSTGILYWPNAAFPSVAENPTLDDAKASARVLLDVVQDFPFAKPHHKIAWLAGLLTMIARSAIDGSVPMFAVDATTAGTGKGRLVDCAAMIAYGREAAKGSQSAKEEEQKKVITSVVMAGDPCVVIDNITRPLGGDALEVLITSTTWEDRVLGRTEIVRFPNSLVVWATANNLILKGDMGRRVIQVRLESQHENPEERTGFAQPRLLEWVSGHRAKFVAAALTMLRAYVVAGRPQDGPTWGSFESWAELVPGCIRWCGLGEVLAARATANEDMDPTVQHLVATLEGITKLDPTGRGLTSRQIVDACFPGRSGDEFAESWLLENPEIASLRDVIETITHRQPGRPPEQTKFGYFLRSKKGKIRGGLRLETPPRGNTHTVKWTVRAVGS